MTFTSDPRERVNQTVSAISREPRSVLAMLLSENGYQSRAELKGRFASVTSDVWPCLDSGYVGDQISAYMDKPGFTTSRSYTIGELEGTEYRLTEAGRKYLQPAAALALEEASRLGIPFYSIFENSAVKRFRLLEQLLRHKERRILDLERALKVKSSNIHLLIDPLQALGFVESESTLERRHGWSPYIRKKDGISIDEVETVANCPGITRAVAKYFEQPGTESDHGKIQKYLHSLGYRTAMPTISSILSGLAEKNYLRRVRKYGRGRHNSSVRLAKDEAKRNFVRRVVETINGGMEDGPELGYMQGLRDRYLSDSDLIKHRATLGVKMYMEVSPQISPKDLPHYRKVITDYLKTSGRATRRDIARKLGVTAVSYLARLVSSGDLKIGSFEQPNGRSNTYYSVELPALPAKTGRDYPLALPAPCSL
jgi:predicted transcriptional regulator